MEKYKNKVLLGDCVTLLGKVKEPFANLIFADPPFNIGYEYDKHNDNLPKEKYVDWTKEWMQACYSILCDSGSFYIAIGDEYVANVKNIADDLELTMRNWIIWHYTFGQQMRNKFARSHTHILYFVKNESNFTFNDQEVRVISDRQKDYKDKRANPAGKLPDDVWNEYPRLCGTFKERLNFPCQMPENILSRIIIASSNRGDWVLDPFCGSGTTAAVAKKLGRNYTTMDISKEYVASARKRIKNTGHLPIEGQGRIKWSKEMDEALKWLYHENKVPTEQLGKDKFLLTIFTNKFNSRLGFKNYLKTPEEITDRLMNLRKSGKLGALRGEKHKVLKRKSKN